MPNHCENTVTISGDPEEVKKTFAFMANGENPFDFNKVIPYPKEYEDRDKEFEELGWDGVKAKYGKGARNGYNSGGYEWRIGNWGTKWNSYDHVVTGNTIRFDTAWAPPMPVIKQLHTQIPTVNYTLTYKEPGMLFGGTIEYKTKQDSKHPDWAPGVHDLETYYSGDEYWKKHPEEKAALDLEMQEDEEPTVEQAQNEDSFLNEEFKEKIREAITRNKTEIEVVAVNEGIEEAMERFLMPIFMSRAVSFGSSDLDSVDEEALDKFMVDSLVQLADFKDIDISEMNPAQKASFRYEYLSRRNGESQCVGLEASIA